MIKSAAHDGRGILVTGGTSGLGLELVRVLLKAGYNVTATGRQLPQVDDSDGRFRFCRVDFADLKTSAAAFRDLASDNRFFAVVNNAGVLSPPELTRTSDGLEYTFQVNFLAHLLLNEILLRNKPEPAELKIITVTSPVYRIGVIRDYQNNDASSYSPVRAYSSSKLYLAMMHTILKEKHDGKAPLCYSFDPGTFSSGISRLQKKWFRAMYKIAAPFMRNPSKVAVALAEFVLSDNVSPGAIYNSAGKCRSLPEFESTISKLFIGSSYAMINEFVDNKPIFRS
jgi:NAD(P)-dependent dehydrogenase (short-subunit alcohol dehydrogenase family)